MHGVDALGPPLAVMVGIVLVIYVGCVVAEALRDHRLIHPSEQHRASMEALRDATTPTYEETVMDDEPLVYWHLDGRDEKGMTTHG